MINNIYDFYYISASGSYQVWTGGTTFGRIIIPNTLVGTIQVIDGTSGSTANVASFGAGTPAGTYMYDVTCGRGLRIVTSSSSDLITIAFKTH